MVGNLSLLYPLARTIDDQFDALFTGLFPNTEKMIESSKDKIVMALYQKPDNEAKCVANKTAVKSLLCSIESYAHALLGSIECGLNDDPTMGAPLGNSLANVTSTNLKNLRNTLNTNCWQKTTLADVITCVLNAASIKNLIYIIEKLIFFNFSYINTSRSN